MVDRARKRAEERKIEQQKAEMEREKEEKRLQMQQEKEERAKREANERVSGCTHYQLHVVLVLSFVFTSNNVS